LRPELARIFTLSSSHSRSARLVLLFVAGFVGVATLPPWIGALLGALDRPLRRQMTLVFLDALTLSYILSLVTSITATSVLILLRARGVRVAASPLQAKLLLLSTSVLISLAALEAGALGWRLWLHRSPRLRSALAAATTAGKDESTVPLTGTVPSLPDQLPAREAGAAGPGAPLRIVVIGESSGRGEPYQPWLSVGQIAAWRLEKVFPGRRIELEIWAVGGAILEMMHHKLAELTYRPDALVVYIGHNEFQARFAWMRDVDYYLDEDRAFIARAPEVVAWSRLFRFSPLCQLIAETRERQQVDTVPPRYTTREIVERPACTAAETAAILADFKRRLDDIASYCESIGTLPVFIIPASNDGDYDPNRSVLAAETPKSERVAFAREVVRARSLEQTDRAGAIRINRKLLDRHPEFAETHYRLARLLAQSACWSEARAHYIQARERDGMPIRCPEAFRHAFRAVAARHPAVLLVDGPKVLEAKSLHGILDGRFFHDAQHPNLHGYVALAEDLLNQLGARHAFGWPALIPIPTVVPEACAAHFGINAARWQEICRREGGLFRAVANIRYDSRFRNRRTVAYQLAAKALREGKDPSDADIPGWAMPPAFPASRRIPRGKPGGRPWFGSGEESRGEQGQGSLVAP
jgi:hypothetical protein